MSWAVTYLEPTPAGDARIQGRLLGFLTGRNVADKEVHQAVVMRNSDRRLVVVPLRDIVID